MTPLPALSSPVQPAPRPTNADPEHLRALATQLEAGFLSEMLAHAGLGGTPEGFGGGTGEDQFASFLRQAQADAIAASGGIGLAEQLFRAMTAEAENGR